MRKRSKKQPKSRKRRFRLPKNSLAIKRLPKPLRSDSVLFLDGSMIMHCFIHKLDHRKMENMIDGIQLTLSATDCTWKEIASYVNYFTEHIVADIHETVELSRIKCGHTDKKLAENPLIPVLVVEGGAFSHKGLSRSKRRKLNLPDSVIEPEDDPDEARLMDRVMFYDFALIDVEGDGNCLLKALSEQMTHSQGDHKIVQERLANEIRDNEELYMEDVQIFMDAHQEIFGLDRKYSSFLRHFSVVNNMVPVGITLQAASNLFKAKIVCLTSSKRVAFLEFNPHDVDNPHRGNAYGIFFIYIYI